PMIEKLISNYRIKDFDKKISPEKVSKIVWKAVCGNKVHWPVGFQFSISYIVGKYLPYQLISNHFKSRYSIISGS
ncbi:MAG: hypothetical protein WAU91_11560, partial [Desulfatitalea sp.]